MMSQRLDRFLHLAFGFTQNIINHRRSPLSSSHECSHQSAPVCWRFTTLNRWGEAWRGCPLQTTPAKSLRLTTSAADALCHQKTAIEQMRQNFLAPARLLCVSMTTLADY